MSSTSIMPSGPSSGGTKFDMSRNPAYQIDCQVEANGKRVAATKRRIRFRFGFASAAAVAEGAVGTDCRGEEHEIVVVWSLASGKQLVLADGREVHFACGNRETKLKAAWAMPGGHQLQIRAYAYAKAQPGFRQFDLLLDGLSFWDMPKIFELGVRRPVTAEPLGYALAGKPGRSRASRGGEDYDGGYDGGYDQGYDGGYNNGRDNSYNNSYSNGHDNSYDNGYNNGYDESPRNNYGAPDHNRPARRATIEGNPTAAPTAPTPQPEPAPEAPRRASMPDLLAGGPIEGEDLLGGGSDHHTQAPALLGNSPYSPTGVADEFAPVEPTLIETMPSFQRKANEILSAYGPQMSSPVFPALADAHHRTVDADMPHTGYEKRHPATPETVASAMTYTPGSTGSRFTFSERHYQQQQTPPPARITVGGPDGQSSPANSTFRPSISTPLNLQELDRPDVGEEASPLEKTMASLVNFDDITTTLETPQQIAARKRREAQKPVTSKPLPATSTTSWLAGSDTPLSTLQSARPAQPKKEVMRTHAFDPAAAGAGMMVVYGNGIPAPNGFGAGGFVRPMHAAYRQ